MWIPKKQWKAMEKRVADLEKRVQDQPLEIISALHGHRAEQLAKTNVPYPRKK